jgi:hypothetical protein
MDILDKSFFYAARIGFEFEFYSKFSKREIAENLGKNIGKSIRVFDRYHSKFKPNSNVFKLESDFSGGVKMVELVTGPMNYFEAIPLLIRILKWIDQYGYTDEKCAFQFGLDFDREKYPVMTDFKNLNPLKFVLSVDEDFIWKRFPKRKGNLYAKSIKRITPINKFIQGGTNIMVDRNSYSVHTEKNMGVNLLKLSDGYIEVRYIGGEDYQKNYIGIKEIIDYIVGVTFETLKNNDNFAPKEVEELSKIISEVYKSSENFVDADSFMRNYPELKVMIDLKSSPQIIKSYFNTLKDMIYHLVVDNGITDCYLNYDTELSKFQIKDAQTKKANLLKDLDIIDSRISGNISNCRIFGSDLAGCQVEDSSFVINSNVINSKVTNCDLNPNNTFENCYIDSREKEISCKVIGGIIRSGYISDSAEISDETEVVSDMLDAKGKKDKMANQDLFPDRNYPDAAHPDEGFVNLNDKKDGIMTADYFNRNIPVVTGRINHNL